MKVDLCHKWEIVHRGTSPEPPKRQKLVCRGSQPLEKHLAPPKSALRHGMGRIYASNKTTLVFVNRESKSKRTCMDATCSRHDTSVDPAAVWSCGMHVPAGLHFNSQGENDSHVMQSPSSGFHLICRRLPYSLHQDPIEYRLWSIFEASACAKPQKSVQSLKHHSP